MSLKTRALQKIFGSTGGTSEFGQIGSKAAASPTTTKNLETMQALSQYDLGLNAIVSDQGTSVLPYLEDINSLFFLTTSQLAYLMQSGVPEWNDETEYYLDVSIVLESGILWKDIYGTGGTPNLNFQPSTNLDKWKPISTIQDVVSIADGANIATDCSTGSVFPVTIAGNRTLDNPTNKVLGKTYTWVITQDGTGGRTLAFGTDFDFIGGSDILTGIGEVSVIVGTVMSSSSILCKIITPYEEVSLSEDLTSYPWAATQALVSKAAKIGRAVTVDFEALTGAVTQSSVISIASYLPTNMRPTSDKSMIILIENSSSPGAGYVLVSSTGSITIYANIASALFDSSDAGFPSFSITFQT